MLVLADCRISAQAVRTLRDFGHTALLCPPHPVLDPAVSSHPDMLCFPAKESLFVHADYIRVLPPLPLAVTAVKAKVGASYPHDVLLNAACIGKHLVCRPDATASEILRYAEAHDLQILPVKQGYAKCNVCIVSEHAAITEDAAIAHALQAVGKDVLHLTPGHVALPGYPYGFIGGASGNDGKHVFFCGDLAMHPQGEKIATFCIKHDKEPISLANHTLTDIGSLLFI